jgi:hypothetical protein
MTAAADTGTSSTSLRRLLTFTQWTVTAAESTGASVDALTIAPSSTPASEPALRAQSDTAACPPARELSVASAKKAAREFLPEKIRITDIVHPIRQTATAKESECYARKAAERRTEGVLKGVLKDVL